IGGDVVLTSRGGGRVGDASGTRTRQPAERSDFRYPLSVPGEVRFPGTGWVLAAEPISSTESARVDRCAISGNGPAAIVRADRLDGILAVRSRRPGDRFQPAGLTGHRKLQDFFVDRKIARADRDRVPLVVDGSDRIIWVAGHRIDETFRVTDGAQPV